MSRRVASTLISSSSPDIALVTGAGSGIGRAVSRALLDDGWAVVLAGRRREPLEETVAGHERATVSPADVTDPESVAALFGGLERLALLFNNAGLFGPPGPLEDLPVDAWRQVVDTNLTGAFLCAQAAFRIMKAQNPRGGRIINNGSISSQVPRPNAIAYTATKHAMTGLTKAIALEGRAHDIACGQIDVGNALTDMTAKMDEPTMDVRHTADAVVQMANLPLDANVLFMTIMATKMPFIGRG
jgi:NAD(P)-dependent dehydrogenase (short-subunit alcohol dehydrogenase family)